MHVQALYRSKRYRNKMTGTTRLTTTFDAGWLA
jgi:hypothetical protein